MGAVALALMLYWLAHAYADSVGDRMHGAHGLAPSGVLASLRHEAWILAGAVPALVAVGLAAAAGASLNAAALAGIWTSAGEIVVIELVLSLRAHRRPLVIAGQALAGAALGLLIIALRVLLH